MLFWAETLLILFLNIVYFFFVFFSIDNGHASVNFIISSIIVIIYFFQYLVSLALVFNLSMSFVTGFCFHVPSGNFFVYPA